MTSIFNASSALDQFFVYTLRISPSGLHLSPELFNLSLAISAVGLYSLIATVLILAPWLSGNGEGNLSAKEGFLQVSEATLYDSVLTFVSPIIKS
jgi:hypothetical protein